MLEKQKTRIDSAVQLNKKLLSSHLHTQGIHAEVLQAPNAHCRPTPQRVARAAVALPNQSTLGTQVKTDRIRKLHRRVLTTARPHEWAPTPPRINHPHACGVPRHCIAAMLLYGLECCVRICASGRTVIVRSAVHGVYEDGHAGKGILIRR